MGTTTGKIALVTGTSSGIGREIALGLAKKGYSIAMISRDSQRGQDAQDYVIRKSHNSQVKLFLSDFRSMSSVAKVADLIDQEYPKLHLVVSNAAIWHYGREETLDGFESTLAVNHLAPFLLLNLLVNKLKDSAPARVVIVASTAHRVGTINFEDLQYRRGYSGFRAYANSKLANVMFAYELANRLKSFNIDVNALHPGTVKTNLFSQNKPWFIRAPMRLAKYLPFILNASQGALTPLYVATAEELVGTTAGYFDKKRLVPSSQVSYDRALGKKLWELSASMTAQFQRGDSC